MKYVDNLPSRRNKRFVRLVATWRLKRNDNRKDRVHGKRRRALLPIRKSKRARFETLNPMPF